MGFPSGDSIKESAGECRRHKMWVHSLGREDALAEGRAAYSSILAWEIPWQRSLAGYSPGRLQSWVRLSELFKEV